MAKSGPSKLTSEQRADADRLARLMKQAKTLDPGLTYERIAERYMGGVGSAYVGHLVRGERPLNTKALAQLARALGCAPADISPHLAQEIRDQASALIPLESGFSEGGSRSGPSGRQTSPTATVRGIAVMDNDGSWDWQDMEPGAGSVRWYGRGRAYAVKVVGEAMYPRFRTGSYVIVREDAIVEPDCDVLVVLKSGRAMIREMVSEREGVLVLRSIRGDRRQSVPVTDIDVIHRIVGHCDASELIS